MALSQSARTKILRAMRIFKSLMIFRSVGPSALSKMQLRELQMSGLLKKFKDNSAPIVEAYLKTHEQMAADGNFAPLSMRNGAINFLERMTERYVGKAVDQLSADIQSKVESTIMPFSDTNEGRAIYGTLKDPKNFSKYLGNELNGKVENWENRYKTIVHTELHRAANWGSLDAILHNSNGADPSEITAYKRGNKPGAGACSDCADMWYEADRVTPKLYKLSDLIANGSNIGRKKKDWLPGVDLTHPNCTHILHKLQNGFGFDSDGTPKYINKDHNELEVRNNMMKSEFKNSDLNSDGYLLRHTMSPEDKASGKITVRVYHPKDSAKSYSPVGSLSVEGGQVKATSVHENHQRKGLATAMYNHAEKMLGTSLQHGDEQSPDAVKFWNARVNKSEPLDKGAMQRLAPFNPSKDAPSTGQIENINTWQGAARRSDREKITADHGPARDRFLHKLSGKTKTRKALDGGREFLLHRGSSGGRLLPPGHNPETQVSHTENTSWTPNYEIAHGFAASEAEPSKNIDSAWVHEKHILTVPKQFGNVVTGSTNKGKGSNSFSNEHEVIVGPHTSEKAEHKSTPFTEVRSDINERITRRGQKGYSHFQHPAKVLEQRRSKTPKDPK